MSEVLIDDLNLNKIANSIRRKNGLVRTYKPREMAPAIQAFRDHIPSAHEYNVIINQSAHQQITVKKYLNPDRANFSGTFTVTEPFYNLEVLIEPDVGYEAGTLNVQSPIVLDRDIIIEATPAVLVEDSDMWTKVYCNGDHSALWGNWSQWTTHFWTHWADEQLTQNNAQSSHQGNIILIDVSNGVHADGRSIYGNTEWGSADQVWRSTETAQLIMRVKVENLSNMQYCFRRVSACRKIDFRQSNNTENCGTFAYMFLECSSLRYIPGIENMNTSELLYCNNMFSGCSMLNSLNLSGWTTPKLISASNMFEGCSILYTFDISNWNTSTITSMNMPPNAKYIIMDKDEVKFSGDYIFPNPNNNVKYLVPPDMVIEYKAHPNWQSRASQIYDITEFTILRNGSEVFVSPNEQ